MAGWKQQQRIASQGGDHPDVCQPVPPFWWMGPKPWQTAESEPSNAYETAGQFQTVEKVDVLNGMKLDDAGEYLPGEVFRNQKSPVQVGQTTGCGTVVQWTPRSPDFYKPFDPESVPRSNNYLYSTVKRRQMMDLASTLKEDSDYSFKEGPMCSMEDVAVAPPIYGASPSAAQPISGHPVNAFGYNPAALTPCQRIIEATNAHIAGTNPFCFRDVIGRN